LQDNLQGLRAIASHCPDLCGLNLKGITGGNMKDHIGLWQVLSNMKLTYLVVDICVLHEVKHRLQLVSLFKTCSSL